MRLSPVPPLLLAAVLLAPAALAQETDKDTLDGMDAETRGDWVEAARAFERAVAAQPGDTRCALRLRYARQRGLAVWKPQIEQMLKEKRLEDAAHAVTVASVIDPGDAAVVAAARQLEEAGVKVAPPVADEPVSPLFPGRSAAGRLRCRSMLGPPFGKASRLIDDGVRYLLAAQAKGGNWEPGKHGGFEFYDAGVTGLALLALLVDGPGGLLGDRGKAARRAADYLAGPVDDGGTKEVYCMLFATEALAEYAAVAGETERLRPALERARDSLVNAQNPGAGWQYKPRCGKSDTSVTGRAVSALHRLRLAGIDAPDGSMRDAMAWVDSMVEPSYGQIGYDYPGGQSARLEEMATVFPGDQTQSMTAAGVLITCYAAAERTWRPKSLALLSEVPPTSRYPDMYYWELGSRAHTAATGTVPVAWYAALVDAAAKCAKADGGMADCDPWQGEGGRIYATAMTVLALAAPFSEPPPKRGDPRTASEFLRSGGADVRVAAVTTETATGLYADPGMKINVIVRGTIEPWVGSPWAAWDGIKSGLKSNKPLLKGAPFACLLGRIGPEGKPFRILSEKPLTLNGHGQLFLLVNDERPGDGAGEWSVAIRLVR